MHDPSEPPTPRSLSPKPQPEACSSEHYYLSGYDRGRYDAGYDAGYNACHEPYEPDEFHNEQSEPDVDPLYYELDEREREEYFDQYGSDCFDDHDDGPDYDDEPDYDDDYDDGPIDDDDHG